MAGETDTLPARGDHVVHFYDRSDALVDAVVPFLAPADTGSIVVFATETHREQVAARLARSGLDLDAAHAAGSLALLDAEAALAEVMVNGSPDAPAFDGVVGAVIRDAAACGRPVRAFGELVGLLWGAGHLSAALEVEHLWEGLASATPFSLFCAYPSDVVADVHVADAFAQVCHLHADVVGGAPLEAAADACRRFAPATHAARLARRFVLDKLREWDRLDVADDCLVVVSELATNAIRHGRSDVTVSLSRLPAGVRVAVGDASATPPMQREPDGTDPGGRGLHLVAGLADRWGHSAMDAGKLVWAEISAADDERSAG